MARTVTPTPILAEVEANELRGRMPVRPALHDLQRVPQGPRSGRGANAVAAAGQAHRIEEAVGGGKVTPCPALPGQGRVLPALLGLGKPGGVGGRGIPVHRLLRDAGAVERHAEGLADVAVVEGLLARVQVEEHRRARVGVPVLVAGRILGHPVPLDIGEEQGRPVDLVRVQRADDLLVAAVQRDTQHVDGRLARLPIGLVPAELIDGRLELPHLHVGAGADG